MCASPFFHVFTKWNICTISNVLSFDSTKQPKDSWPTFCPAITKHETVSSQNCVQNRVNALYGAPWKHLFCLKTPIQPIDDFYSMMRPDDMWLFMFEHYVIQPLHVSPLDAEMTHRYIPSRVKRKRANSSSPCGNKQRLLFLLCVWKPAASCWTPFVSLTALSTQSNPKRPTWTEDVLIIRLIEGFQYPQCRLSAHLRWGQ